MNEKIRNILILFLVCVIVVLTLLLGFVLGMKYANKDNNLIQGQTKEESNKLTEEELYEVSNILFKRLSNIDSCGGNIIRLNIGEKLHYQNLTENYISSYVLNSLFIEEKVQKDLSDAVNSKYKISIEEYKKEFEKVFGIKNDYQIPNKISAQSFVFELVGNEYIGSLVYQNCQVINPIYYLRDYSQDGDKIYLIVYLLQQAGNNKYYLNNNSYTIEELIQSHESEITKYKYTFKIENNNYIFESIEGV